MGFISQLLGNKPKIDFKALVESGALVLDVRSETEFSGGHINKSKNIPLNQLSNRLAELGQTKTIITVCASGIRSGAAISTLEKAGYIAYNGGSWQSLNRKISTVG